MFWLIEENWFPIPYNRIIIRKVITNDMPPPLGVATLWELLSFGITIKNFLSNGFNNFKVIKVDKNPTRKKNIYYFKNLYSHQIILNYVITKKYKK